jgi:predicted nucleic acid-binding protein
MGISVRVFLDTSALFADIWSAEGGARMILKLGEARAIRILVSPQVLTEAEQVLRRKAPDMLGLFALLLDRSGVETVPAALPDAVQECLVLTGYLADAVALAAAKVNMVDYFVTLDREHFLSNDGIKRAMSFPVGTPGDFLAWYRGLLAAVPGETA